MLYRLSIIAAKEIKLLLKDKSTLLILFFFPVIFLTLMIYASVGKHHEPFHQILIVNNDHGPLADRIVQELRAEEHLFVRNIMDTHVMTLDGAKKILMTPGSHLKLILVFSSNFSEALIASEAAETTTFVKFILNPMLDESSTKEVTDIIEKHIIKFSNNSPEFKEMLGKIDKIDKTMRQHILFRLIAPNNEPYRFYTEIEYNFPGYIIFTIFFIVPVIGNTFLRERENGTFGRLMISPVHRPILLIGKLIPFYALNIIQILFLFFMAYLFFHVRLGSSFLGLFFMTIALTAVANALGLCIATYSKSEYQMSLLSALILVLLETLGGIFIPYFEMPHVFRSISFFTPQAWALKGFQDVLLRGSGFIDVLPSAAILLLFAIVLYAIALKRLPNIVD